MLPKPLTALNFRISSITGYALADCLMLSCITYRVDATRVVFAWIFALTYIYITVTVVRALVVASTAGRSWILWFTVAFLGKAVSVFDGTHATTSLVEVHSTLEGTHAMAGLIYTEAFINGTWNAVIVEIKGKTGLAHTFTVLVANKTLVDTAEGFCEANRKSKYVIDMKVCLFRAF